MINLFEKVLILSPHTDDGELGCGGLIARLIEEKKEILWVVFSTAEDSIPSNLPKDILHKEFVNVCSSLGLTDNNYKVFNYNVRKLDQKRQEILEALVKIRKEFNPNVVIGPSLNDFHQDHQVVSNEMVRAYKSSATIIHYELPWNHVKFDTQLFVKLDERHVAKKLELIKFYESQFLIQRPYFSEDFIKGLASTRGAQIGVKYAESFEVTRWIV
jgi:LmbE family N-acetylglucosaminyl deacetylase